MITAVSIINYNSINLLKPLLVDLLKEKELEIWVVDNKSPDDGVEVIKKEFKKVNLIESKENGGFAKGHNLALRKIVASRGVKTKYVLILNPDTKVPNGAIGKMVEFMEKYPNCGIASCKIVGFDKSLHSNGGDLPLGTSLFSWIFNMELIPGAEQAMGSFHRTDEKYYKKAQKVGWVGGTFMMIRREVFESIGYLPEEYFMYFEDTDFCYRATLANFDIMINPEVVIEHASGASSDNPRLAQFRGEWRGLEIFYRKEFGKSAAIFVKILIYVGILLRIAAFSAIGKRNVAKVYGQVLTSL